MSERKKAANVAVRVPREFRAALTDGGRLALTHVVEDILDSKHSRLARLKLVNAPNGSERVFLSIRADLADHLREIAHQRCTSAGVLVYSLIASAVSSGAEASATGPSRPAGGMELRAAA